MPATYADRLDDYLGKGKAKFYRDINYRFKFSKSAIRNSLMKTKEDCDGDVIKKRNLITRAVFLYTIYNIPLHIFDLTDRDIFSENSIKQSSLQDFLDIEELENNVQVLKSEYPRILEKYISEAQNEIWVYDYFLPVLSKENTYKEAHIKYYEAIEKQLTSYKTMEYHRMLVFDYDPNKKVGIESIDVVRAIARKCSLIGFNHLIRCFTHFENRFTLSYTYFPHRLYSYAIIDTKYLITEYLRYSKQLSPRPDMIFVNQIKNNKEMEKLRVKFLKPFQIQEYNHCTIRKSTFENALRKECENLSFKIKKLKNKVNEIDPLNDPGKDYDRQTHKLEQKIKILSYDKTMLERKIKIIDDYK